MSQITTAIFDLDGTVLDSMWLWEKIDRDFFQKRAIEFPADYMHSICTLTIWQTAEYTKKRFSLDEQPQQLIDEWISSAEHEYSRNIMPKPGAAEYIRLLKRSGFTLAVLTSSMRRLIVPALKRCNLFDGFDVIVSTDDVRINKNNPEIFKYTAEKTGAKCESCIVFDDAISAIEAANAAGMKTVGVYDDTSKNKAEQIKSVSDLYIYSFSEAPIPNGGGVFA